MAEPTMTGGRTRVILIDDRAERRSVMRVVLESGSDGLAVMAEVSTPAEAVAAAQRSGPEPDAAVIEIQIPQVSAGLAAIAHLRAEHPAMTIVVCSFLADVLTQAEALAAGADSYLIKPVSAKDLHAACRAGMQATR